MIRLPVYLASATATGVLLGMSPGLQDAGDIPLAGTTVTVETLLLVATLLVGTLAWRWRPARWAASTLAIGAVCWSLSDESHHPFWLGGAQTTGEAPTASMAMALLTLLLAAATHAAEDAVALRDAIRARGEPAATARRDAGRAVLRWLAVAGIATATAGALMAAAGGLKGTLGDLDDPLTRTIAVTVPVVLLAIGAILLGGGSGKRRAEPAPPADDDPGTAPGQVP